MKDLKELEQIYLQAKEAYYNTGNSILSDEEFDSLEDQLRELGSSIIQVVGYTTLRKKIKHLSPMLSLSKIKATEDSLPIKEFQNWIKKFSKLDGGNAFEITPKYDGNSCSVIYQNGNFSRALSRGNGKEGQDISNKITKLVPSMIGLQSNVTEYSVFNTIEIRGEVLISLDVFEKKYSKDFMNARNFVAGVLNNKDYTDAVEDLVFMPYEVRHYINENKYDFHEDIYEFFRKNDFKNIPDITKIEFNDNGENIFTQIYNQFKIFRTTSQYQLDGFVIKAYYSHVREELGENDHDPNWGLAVKFPPKETIATINSIQWQLGKTGELTPIGILNPVELEGSIVARCSLHNYRYVLDNKLFPNSQVSLFKAGDIIPQIQKVIKGSISKYEFPTKCEHCNSVLFCDGIRLECKNIDCSGIKYFKFKSGIELLELDFVGGKTLEKIFEKFNINAYQLFNKSIINKQSLSEVFGEGKNTDRIFDSINKIKKLTLQEVILMLGINDLGKHISKELALMYCGLEYSTFSLEKKFFEIFKNGTEYYTILEKNIDYLKSIGIEIEYPVAETKEDTSGVITFEMTGELLTVDKFKTKEDFAEWIKEFGYKHTSLTKKTNLLVADKYDSNTGKMQKAKKYGTKIITYEDLYDQLMLK